MLCAASQVFALPSEQNHHDKGDAADKRYKIAGTMCPQVNQKRNVSISGNAISDRANKKYPTIRGSSPTDKAREHRDCIRDSGQANKWSPQCSRFTFGPASQTACSSKRDTEEHTNPPSRDNTPSESEQRWVIGWKNRWMANGKVFNADASGDLVVDDAIQHAGCDAHQDNRDPFH